MYHGTQPRSARTMVRALSADKPAIAVDHARGTSTDPCGHNVYIAWARFNGNDPQGKFHSIMNFMRSTDKGLSFTPTTPVKLDGNFTRGQGAAIAARPEAWHTDDRRRRDSLRRLAPLLAPPRFS